MIKPLYIGRQPILDLKKETVAYEILYRAGEQSNEFPIINGTMATNQVLYSLFYSLDFQKILGGKKAFINFTKENLLQEFPVDIAPNHIVIELLENIDIDNEVLDACKTLKNKGYKIALDDFFLKDRSLELLHIADIVKVDWVTTNIEEIEQLTKFLKRYDVSLLAEKIEHEKEYRDAIELGYKYFQGYFFEKPTIIRGEDVSPTKWTYLKLFSLVQRPEIESEELVKIIKHDPALAFKLLNLINSAAFSLPNEVKSVEQAITLIGETEIRRWLSLVLMANLCEDQPEELIIIASTRARFGELIAIKIGQHHVSPTIFLLGILSLIDTMTGRPMDELFKKIKVHPSIIKALVEKSGPLFPFLYLMLAYERANENGLKKCSEYFNLSYEDITKCYLEAAQWANYLRDI
ncbi:putative signal transduction protein [Dissulfuribacter thermophilus]|uniref:Putative signal transduction protein n=1 Tax=Dissulfuribacter thermophilus TaxID=1156395 RepID=A0A1B9F9A8_9BACT|nr:HDOD domain-containing protein [Dissulfuribacter thermophilus]OCC16482.1 putative signal transduction protein [Dissulfuribacter thermophilus]